MPQHEQTELKHVEIIKIDKEIAPLMEEIWKADLKTRMSCEANKGGCGCRDEGQKEMIWILFKDTKDLVKFMRIQNVSINDIYDSISAKNLYKPTRSISWYLSHGDGKWRFNIARWISGDGSIGAKRLTRQIDAMRNSDVDMSLMNFNYFIDGNVRFPKSELGNVLARLQKHNDRVHAVSNAFGIDRKLRPRTTINTKRKRQEKDKV